MNFYHINGNKETATDRGVNSLDKKRALPVKFSEIFPLSSSVSRRPCVCCGPRNCRMKRIFQALACGVILLFPLLLSSCVIFRTPPRSDPEHGLPTSFSLYEPGERTADRWWEAFSSPELNALVEEALGKNLDLRVVWARLRQVSAQAVQAGSGLYPDLSLGGEGFYRRSHNHGRISEIEEYFLGLASGYELDLWGRIRSEREAARLSEKAAGEDLRAAAMTLAAETAGRWVDVISLRLQKKLLERQLEANRIYLELVELRFFMAMVSALDVYQQKQLVQRVAAQIPLVEEEERLRLHELALLLGRSPADLGGIEATSLPDTGPFPEPGLPADLLGRRPDVRAAGLRLQGADWQVTAARADRLPAFRLAGAAGYTSEAMHSLFDVWYLKLAASLTGPIFDGGRRKAEVERTRGVVDERLAVYRKTVLTAVGEVEDALIREKKRRENLMLIRERTETARKALEQATERYRNGLNDYLPVLTQLISVQDLERELIDKEAALIKTRIDLHRSLGGNWTAEELKPATVEW